MFDLKKMHSSSEVLTRLKHHLLHRRQNFFTTTTGHIWRKNFIAVTNIRMLIQQRSKDTAATAPNMPINNPAIYHPIQHIRLEPEVWTAGT